MYDVIFNGWSCAKRQRRTKTVFGWPLAAHAVDIVMMTLIEFPGQWHMFAIGIQERDESCVRSLHLPALQLFLRPTLLILQSGCVYLELNLTQGQHIRY